MNKLYLLTWHLSLEGQTKKKLYSDLDEAECYYYALKDAIRAGWLCLEELVEVNPSAGFERGETIHYKEKYEIVNGQELM